MSIISGMSGWFGSKRPVLEPPAPGFEHYGGEPADPSISRYWRSIPHSIGIPVPSLGDSALETARRVHSHANGIDEATGKFMDPLIDAEADAIGVAIEERYLDQIRAEQGLWADEDAGADRSRKAAELLRTQLDIADADFRAGRDALKGIPGDTPAWDANLSHEIHRPILPVPGTSPAKTGTTVATDMPVAGTAASMTEASLEHTNHPGRGNTENRENVDTQGEENEEAA